jgi:hypothetical protein
VGQTPEDVDVQAFVADATVERLDGNTDRRSATLDKPRRDGTTPNTIGVSDRAY